MPLAYTAVTDTLGDGRRKPAIEMVGSVLIPNTKASWHEDSGAAFRAFIEFRLDEAQSCSKVIHLDQQELSLSL